MNRLSKEKSLYLLQHSNNPVQWYPWSNEAFIQAKRKNLPIFLSIGYSSCHWCHVMEKESFESVEISKIMNENFINIKVDREELPDVDSIYMKAVQTMTGSGGWPLSVFLTPDLDPFYGGTYFPPEDRHGIPSFSKVLFSISDHWKNQNNLILENVDKLKDLLSQKKINKTINNNFEYKEEINEIFEKLLLSLDLINGGTKGAPKFPQIPLFEFLTVYYNYYDSKMLLNSINITLEKMSKGGIHDHLYGGFHRYSTDSFWSVPHFEKMLYDNALISRFFIQGYYLTGKVEFLQIAEKTIDFIFSEMNYLDIGFISSIDADTNGVEGLTYIWEYNQLVELLSEEQFSLANDHWILSEKGNHFGSNVLNIKNDKNYFKLNKNYSKLVDIYDILKSSRSKRPQPAKDNKMIVSWMSLVIQTVCEFVSVKNNPDLLNRVEKVANNIFQSAEDSKFFHIVELESSSMTGRIPAFLSDYSELSLACLSLYQTTFNKRWLDKFLLLGNIIAQKFWDSGKEQFMDSQDTENLYINPRDTFDNAIYSGISSANLVMLYMYSITSENKFLKIFEDSFFNEYENIKKYPNAYPGWLKSLVISKNLEQVVIVGNISEKNTREMLKIATTGYNPSRIVIQIDKTDPDLLLLKDKIKIDDLPTGYFCKDFICKLPTNSIKDFNEICNNTK